MMAGSHCFSRLLILLVICAAAGCGAPPPAAAPADAELDRSNSAARAAYDRGALSEAATLYEQSLTRARAMDDPQEVADSAYNLAACLMGLNDLDRARQLLHEAQWELAKTGKNADDVLLLEAKIARQQGKYADALALTDRLISQPRPKGSSVSSINVYVLRGNLALDRHDVAAARIELAAARAVLGSDALTSAGITGLSARIEQEENHPAIAAAQFDAQAALLQRAASYSEMFWALGRAGNAYLAASQPEAAADRLYRAARCAFAQGNMEQAHRLLEGAARAADVAKASSLVDQIRELQVEMSVAATRPSATTLPSIPTEATAPQ